MVSVVEARAGIGARKQNRRSLLPGTMIGAAVLTSAIVLALLVVIFWLFILAALFWSGFEQAGSSLNFLARDYIDMPKIFGSSPRSGAKT